LEQLERGETGTETYEIASDEDMSVMEVAEIVREAASAERGSTWTWSWSRIRAVRRRWLRSSGWIFRRRKSGSGGSRAKV